jgi:cytochrome c553
MMMRFHMLSSFDTARAIERLLIRGKLDDARYFAQSLATEPDIPGLAPWAKQVELVRERAAAVGTAPGVDEACRREARLAEACARCHLDASAQADFQPPREAPPDLQTVAARMARHRWAADRVREGMIGGSDDAWRAGLDVLAATPLSWPDPGSNRKDLARQLQHLADQARHPVGSDLAERARLYGEILVTCAACHAQPGSTKR